jgi:hypothetical protein
MGLLTVSHIDGDALAFRQAHNALATWAPMAMMRRQQSPV